MPLRQAPQFKVAPDSFLNIAQPGIGGLNLKDLEYEQETYQSPKMLNMMYRNGAFSKRYGQDLYDSRTWGTNDELKTTFNDKIYASTYFMNHIVIHCGTSIFLDNYDNEIYTGVEEKRGLFCKYNQNLYYICGEMYVYDGENWEIVEPFVPTVVINRHANPSDGEGDAIEPYNMLGYGFQNNFDGDGTSTIFYLTDKNLVKKPPKVTVNNEVWTYDPTAYSSDTAMDNKTFRVSWTNGRIKMNPAPGEGDNNVEIIAYKTDAEWQAWNDRVMSSKYYAAFGGNNNSRLFLAGSGDPLVIYSEVYDASYFPYNNYIRIGNGAEDITGFGQQYNILCVFKPDEVFALEYYINTENTTTDDSQVGVGAFSSKAVNAAVGCDCPGTIQLINSQLTWLNSKYGVCTLVSTNVVDERNVRTISRNIDRTNFLGVQGLLDWPDIEKTVSVDFDNKYFLANPTTGMCYMWDYGIAPYGNTGRVEADAKRIAWFLFDNFYVEQFQPVINELMYISGKNFVRLNESFNDFGNSINAYYMTPLFSYYSGKSPATDYLKTIKNIYVQCRGETPTYIHMKYITEENAAGEVEQDDISVYSKLWRTFNWSTFGWRPLNFQEVFRRKCSIKKVQVMGVLFENNLVDADMSISHLSLQYQLVKNVK